MWKFNVPSAGASSQEGSSSLPTLSLWISISVHYKESLISIIRYCDNVGLTIDKEHKLYMYKLFGNFVDLCAILAFASTSILPNCAYKLVRSKLSYRSPRRWQPRDYIN